MLSFGAVALGSGLPAQGQEQQLVRQLKSDPDYKVRLSAALALGKRGQRSAVPALVDCLGDSVPTVRAVCAGALSTLVDRQVPASSRGRALAELSRLLKGEREQSVKSAATLAIQAIERIERLARPRKTHNSIFVNVEKLADPTGQLSRDDLASLTEVARETLLEADQAFIVDWPGERAPSGATLAKAKTRGAFSVMGTFDELTVQPNGRRAKIACKLRLILATYPEKAIREFISGAAKLDTSSSKDSVERAKMRCASDVLSHLMATQMAPGIKAKAR